MVSHLGCSAPLPKTADPELDTDSVIVAPIIGVLCLFHVLLCAVLCVLSSFSIILMGKRERESLTFLSSWGLVTVTVSVL